MAITNHERAPAGGPASEVLVIVLVYALAGSLWIFGSDWLLGQLVTDAALLAQVSAYKGWGFIAITSLLLYRVLRRVQRAAQPSAGQAGISRSTSHWPLIAAVVAIVLATAAAARFDYASRWEQGRIRSRPWPI